jgi:hypothetical protein
MSDILTRMTAFGSSAWITGRLLLSRRLRLPRENVGRALAFADGSNSRVFRETVWTGPPTRDPALLVVRFQLRLVGRSRLLHAAFRKESIANTPLFAGFPGFRSKLWMSDAQTGVYRGLYEWDGAGPAASYATSLAALLRPVCVRGSVAFHVEPGVRRDEVLRGSAAVGDARATGPDQWWRLREPVPA